ncbi:hypothetical protein ABFS82_08G127800 [Erythranthe guttata]
MWSLGKVLSTPKAPRVYIGSFDDKPEHEAAIGNDFEQEQDDLLLDLEDVPKKACDRKINEFVKRARSAKIHSYIISQFMKDMLPLVCKAKAKKKLMHDLEKLFAKQLGNIIAEHFINRIIFRSSFPKSAKLWRFRTSLNCSTLGINVIVNQYVSLCSTKYFPKRGKKRVPLQKVFQDHGSVFSWLSLCILKAAYLS